MYVIYNILSFLNINTILLYSNYNNFNQIKFIENTKYS